MTGVGRRWRLAVTAVVFGALVLGTVAGDDEHFPFGPFRMYASTQDADAPTSWLELEVTTAAGERRVLADGAAGLRRAEVEGSVGRFVAAPAALAPILERADPSALAIAVVRHTQPMVAGRPDGAVTTEVVASWRRP